MSLLSVLLSNWTFPDALTYQGNVLIYSLKRDE